MALKPYRQTNLVNMNQNHLKIREKRQNSLTKFQLSYFNTPETPIKQGIYASGTIEWE